MEGAEAPQMDEQPVALAMTMRSPNSWVSTLTYGVFTATRACAREFEQGLVELAALDAVTFQDVILVGDGLAEFEVGHLFGHLRIQGFHDQGLFLGRADVRAVAAAHAVHGVYLEPEVHPLEFLAHCVDGLETGRRVFQLFVSGKHRAQSRVRANERALVALDAVFRDPVRRGQRDTALFVLAGANREASVRFEGADRQDIPALFEHGTGHVGHECGLVADDCRIIGQLCPGVRIVHFHQACHGLVPRPRCSC